MDVGTTLRGSCHCGKVSLSFETTLVPGEMHPRACDCSFCQKHGAMYVSDPAGRLRVAAKGPGGLRRYRQGSGSAEFLLCADCGVLVAVVHEADGTRYGAVNARCIDGGVGFAAPQVVSPQLLSAEEKTGRWRAVWVRGVEVVEG